MVVRNKTSSSETSTSVDDSKKMRDGSLDYSNNPDDVFTERLSSPDCVKILYNCIKNVQKQIHGIHSKTKETKMSQGEQGLMDLNKTFNFISKKFDEYGKSRPIIIKFVTYKTRSRIFKNKKKN